MLNQLQQHLQRLRDEANTISQLAGQLQQSEQNNSSQLQQLQQREVFAAQNLQRIHYLAGQLQQDISQVSSMAQQLTSASTFPQAQTAYQQYVLPTGYAPYQTTSTQYGMGQSGYSTQYNVPSSQYSPYQFNPGYATSQINPVSHSPASPAAMGFGYGQTYTRTGFESAPSGGQYTSQYSG